MDLDYEPVEAVTSLMRTYSRLKYELTGSTAHRKAFWNPKRSQWFGVFKRLYKELMDRGIDPADYLLWALRKDTTKHHAPNQLVSPWRYEAYEKSRKKAQAATVREAVDYETLRGQAAADMQVAMDRWQERGRFYETYRDFLRGEYPSIPSLFLATDTEFFELCKSSQGLMVDKLNDVTRWVAFLWNHKRMAQEVRKIRDRAIGLAAAS